MEQRKGTWRGKPLEEYTKEELIEIILAMGHDAQEEFKRHQRDMAVMSQFNNVYRT